MGLYNVGFAGAAGGEFAERQMKQLLEQRMFEEEQARLERAQAAQVAAEQQRMALDRERFSEGTRQFEVGRTDDLAAAAAETAAKAEQQRLVDEAIAGIPEGPARLTAIAGLRGITGTDVHTYEDPAAHAAHLAAEREQTFEDVARKADITNQSEARYRAKPQGPQEAKSWVMRDGEPVRVSESEIQPGDKPYREAAIRPPTGAERQTLAYFNRAQEALTTAETYEPLVSGVGAVDQLRLQYGPNWAQSPEQQQYRQAQRAFTEARLRKESGAAIPPAEYENDAVTYFAQPGDGPKLTAQKKRARQTVLEGLKFGAGKAYEEFYGEPATREAAQPKKKFTITSVK